MPGMEAKAQKSKIDILVEKYHGLLFTLPSAGRMMAYLLSASSLVGLSLGLPCARSSGLLCPLVLALLMPLSALSSWLADIALLRGDPIMTPRRCIGIELFSLMAYGPFSLLGGIAAFALGLGPNVALRIAVVGLSLSVVARSLTVATASLAGPLRSSACVLAGPSLWLSFVLLASSLTGGCLIGGRELLLVAIGLGVGCVSSLALVMAIDRSTVGIIGRRMMRVARGFSASWIVDYNEPLERFLDEVGVEADVEATIMLFEGPDGEPIGSLVVPGVHPGPFREIGSSPLPGLLQEALGGKLGCPVAVPHGLSGHDLNLTSRRECEKLIKALLGALGGLRGPCGEATPMVRAAGPKAKACCQLFGDIAFLVLTTAPEPSEDFPREVEAILRSRAVSMGLTDVAVVDAHNCINSDILDPEAGLIEDLVSAGSRAIEKALSEPRGPFRAGMAVARPPDFTVEKGLGPGGIAVLAVEVGGRRYAYVVIDGNNMVRGLRETLISELRGLGFEDAEVMTSDTHVVNARLLVERGYHPVGEAMDWGLLAERVRETALEALRRLRSARVRWARVRVEGLRVFGGEVLEKLCEMPIRGLRAAKRATLAFVLPAHVALMALMLLV